MARRAEWKPVRTRPETRGQRWLRRREKVQFVARLWMAVLVPMLALVGIGLTIGWCLGFVAMVGSFVAFAFPSSKRRNFDDRPLSEFVDLLPLPLQEGTFPVSVALSRHGVSTGKDEGIAAFADGWLVVEGRRTSFSFRAGDARSENVSSGMRTVFPDGQELVLWPLSVRGLPPDAGAFYHAIRRWLREDLKPEGEPILPPLGRRWL